MVLYLAAALSSGKKMKKVGKYMYVRLIKVLKQLLFQTAGGNGYVLLAPTYIGVVPHCRYLMCTSK